MRYAVKVGLQYEGISVNVDSNNIVINVTVENTKNTDTTEKKENKPFSIKKVITMAVMASFATAVPASVVYGASTGDYLFFKELVGVVVKVASSWAAGGSK